VTEVLLINVIPCSLLFYRKIFKLKRVTSLSDYNAQPEHTVLQHYSVKFQEHSMLVPTVLNEPVN